MKKLTWLLLIAVLIAMAVGCSKLPDTTLPAITPPATEAPTDTPTETPTESPAEIPTEVPNETGVAPMALVGTWEFMYTEVEGSIVEEGSATITIYGEDETCMYITFRDHLFPDEDFQDKALIFDLREMYSGCGNSHWVMDVDYVDANGNTSYTITLLTDGTLVKQNKFTIEDMPMVSYQFFRKA